MCRQQRFRAGPGKFNIRLYPLTPEAFELNCGAATCFAGAAWSVKGML